VLTGLTLPLDFEQERLLWDFDGGAATTANPNKAGINTTATVAKMVKGAGAQWAGSKLKWLLQLIFRLKNNESKVWSVLVKNYY
jgi:hypothetical protein